VTPEREKELFWLVVIHIVFVVSSVLLALSDRIAGHGAHGSEATPLDKDTSLSNETHR